MCVEWGGGERQTDRQTDRDRDRQRDRDRERQRERKRDRQTDRQTENSKTLFYKDCGLGSMKNLSNNYSLTTRERLHLTRVQ